MLDEKGCEKLTKDEVKIISIIKRCFHEIESLKTELEEKEKINPKEVKERLDAIRPSLTLLTSKWVPDILYALLITGSMGFNDLKKTLGVSSRVLSDKLQELVDNELVEREEIGSSGVRRVRYKLTPKGKKVVISLTPFLLGIYLSENETREGNGTASP